MALFLQAMATMGNFQHINHRLVQIAMIPLAFSVLLCGWNTFDFGPNASTARSSTELLQRRSRHRIRRCIHCRWKSSSVFDSSIDIRFGILIVYKTGYTIASS